MAQNLYIANVGQQNHEWPACLQRSTIATMNDLGAQQYWLAGDRENHIQSRRKGKTAAGLTPTQAVASRWFNLVTVIAEPVGDIWVHSADGQIWWTVSRPDGRAFETRVEPVGRAGSVIVCHKPCEP